MTTTEEIVAAAAPFPSVERTAAPSVGPGTVVGWLTRPAPVERGAAVSRIGTTTVDVLSSLDFESDELDRVENGTDEDDSGDGVMLDAGCAVDDEAVCEALDSDANGELCRKELFELSLVEPAADIELADIGSDTPDEPELESVDVGARPSETTPP